MGRKRVLKQDTKSTNHKEKTNKFDSIKIKNFCSFKRHHKESDMANHRMEEGIYLQHTHMTKDLIPEQITPK